MNQMNERVEELAKEAGMTICELGFPNISEFNIEKFAQLIVLECCEVAQDEIKYQDGDYTADDIINVVKKYFGIE